MPKSGSSFIQTAISTATGFSNILLTNFTQPGISTHFGMSAREQEIDEFAIIYNILHTGGSFIAQHHTCATRFLASQLKFFNIQPIITIRNVFDCIISADDMYMRDLSALEENVIAETLFNIPQNYIDHDTNQRLSILAHTLGIWLIDFYISWKRIIMLGLATPLPIIYENDIITNNIVAKLSQFLQLTNEERAKMHEYTTRPHNEANRFNKGVAGRGQAIPENLKQMLRDYAANFKELSEQDLFLLFENHGPGH